MLHTFGYGFKTCIQPILTSQFVKLASEVREVSWLVVYVKWMPRHAKQSPSTIGVGANNVEVDEGIGPFGRFFGIEHAIWHDGSLVMGPEIQIAGVNHEQDAGSSRNDAQLFNDLHDRQYYSVAVVDVKSRLHSQQVWNDGLIQSRKASPKETAEVVELSHPACLRLSE